MTAPSSRAAYWNSVADTWALHRPHRLWRRFSDELHARLLSTWLPSAPVGRVLKTDAFDEANGDLGRHLLLATDRRKLVTLDVSTAALRLARDRHARLAPVGGDVRALPIQSASFDLVVSTSTLDHLETVEEIGDALAELHRVLRPGGRLILTLDNRDNPIVWLRSVLPQGWLRALRIVPYQTGANCGKSRLREMAVAAGLVPIHVGGLMHCPRLLCVALAAFLDGERAGDAFIRGLLTLEQLDRWPTRFLTGYFVALVAERPRADVHS